MVEDGRGNFTVTLHEREDIRKAHQMQEGIRKLEVERGAEMQARMKRERVVRRDGRTVDIPEELVDNVKHKMRAVGRNGQSAAEHFSMSDAGYKYERGPDGLFFLWQDGWEPVNLWRNGAMSPQRDPDGNVWVERGGWWVLESEAMDGAGES